MFDLKREFGTSEQKELEGVWEEIGGGAKVLIARLGNKAFSEKWNRVPTAVKQSANESVQLPYVCGILASTILLGWEGLVEDGKELIYTQELAKEMLVKYKDFRALVMELSQIRQRFADEEVAEQIKN